MRDIEPNLFVDCAIVGAGIVGMMCARELAAAGLKVALFDKGRPGMESTWAGGGILSPLYPWREADALLPLTRLSQQMYPGLAQELAETTGIDPEWDQSGLLMFALQQEEREQAMRWCRMHGVESEYPDPAAIPRCVSQEQAGEEPLYLPAVAQIRNPRLSQALRHDLESRGVAILQKTNVKRILKTDGQVEGVVTRRGTIRCSQVITSMGAWNRGLIPELDVRPVRGQMLCFKGPAGYLDRILLREGVYIIPRRDGHLLVGSTLEEAGFDKAISHHAADELLARAHTLMPGIGEFPRVGHWAGLRPASRSGLPYICAHPEIHGLYLNVGHYRNGILLAPASARVLVDIMLGRECSIQDTRAFGFHDRLAGKAAETMQ